MTPRFCVGHYRDDFMLRPSLPLSLYCSGLCYSFRVWGHGWGCCYGYSECTTDFNFFLVNLFFMLWTAFLDVTFEIPPLLALSHSFLLCSKENLSLVLFKGVFPCYFYTILDSLEMETEEGSFCNVLSKPLS